MKYMLVLALGLVALAAARPNEIFEFEGKDAEHEQEGQAGKSVTGEYKWESPEGIEFQVKYIADDKGYRVVESNAVPSMSGFEEPSARADFEAEEEEEEEGEEEEEEEEEEGEEEEEEEEEE